MIIQLFAVLLALSILFIFLGYFSDIESLKVSGFTVMFLLGYLLMFTGVEVVSGFTNEVSFEYGSNFTDYHWDQYIIGDEPKFNPSDDEVFLFHTQEVKVDDYTTHTNITIGFILAIMGALGFAEVFFQFGNKSKRLL